MALIYNHVARLVATVLAAASTAKASRVRLRVKRSAGSAPPPIHSDGAPVDPVTVDPADADAERAALAWVAGLADVRWPGGWAVVVAALNEHGQEQTGELRRSYVVPADPAAPPPRVDLRPLLQVAGADSDGPAIAPAPDDARPPTPPPPAPFEPPAPHRTAYGPAVDVVDAGAGGLPNAAALAAIGAAMGQFAENMAALSGAVVALVREKNHATEAGLNAAIETNKETRVMLQTQGALLVELAREAHTTNRALISQKDAGNINAAELLPVIFKQHGSEMALQAELAKALAAHNTNQTTPVSPEVADFNSVIDTLGRTVSAIKGNGDAPGVNSQNVVQIMLGNLAKGDPKVTDAVGGWFARQTDDVQERILTNLVEAKARAAAKAGA